MCLVPKPSTDRITTDLSQIRQNASSSNGYGTKPIEELKVGDRVLANNPEITSLERSTWQEPDWSDWIQLSLEMPKPDGSELNIELLRPETWVQQQLGYLFAENDSNTEAPRELPLGDTFDSNDEASLPSVPLSPLRPLFRELAIVDALSSIGNQSSPALVIEMDLPELQITGPALVLDLRPAPPITPGNGQVITATFHHSSGDVIDLEIGDDVDSETIGTTSNHPFWSVDRGEYVQAGKLSQGERVQTYAGDTKRVLNQHPRPGPQPVYNLEVHAEHVYYVGNSGTLVHNTYGNAKTGIEAREDILDDLDELALAYAIERTNGEVFQWSSVASRLGIAAEKLTPLRSSIRKHARKHGLIPEAAALNKHGVANFSEHVVDVVDLQTGMSLGRKVFVSETIGTRYGLHDRILREKFRTPNGYVWDHMSRDGWFRLVERAVHALTNGHKGYALWRTNPANKK